MSGDHRQDLKETDVNINDVNVEELWSTATKLYKTQRPLKIIFARQQELMEKYSKTEAEIMCEGVLTVPVDIHSARGQRALKARAWWFTEELVEALDALGEEDHSKFLEEISDSIHFLTELWILTDLPIWTIEAWDEPPFIDVYRKIPCDFDPDRIRLKVLDIIVNLGRAMWQLRNKPWKKTQVLTDLPQFSGRLKDTYDSLINLLHYDCGLNMQEICLLYLRKSEVNRFRQRSNY